MPYQSYCDLVKTEEEYNYSANIQFDINNDKKLLRFVPNETAVELLKEYFIDIVRDKPIHHARMLYGSYGTGKSHFLTVLSMLLEKKFSTCESYKSFISKVERIDDRLAHDIDSYVRDCCRKPFLVVPIVSDFDDFSQCVYFSLRKKLETIGKKITFKTFYDQAYQLISQWEAIEDSKIRLYKACEKANVSLPKLKEMLKLFDKTAESFFQVIFSEMTYGVRYFYEVTNIAESISQATLEIADEYSGIVFIFDEFGRYIEDNIKNIKVKSIQDLAEYCDHCEGNNHIILVSHKEISQYTQKFGKNVITEWKKVEGRYKATPINDKQDQCLSLVRNVLIKDESVWNEFKNRFENELKKIYVEALDFNGFFVDTSEGENPFEGVFPLHPISLYALDKLSKKVAQNERTFFTYLASKDDNSLYKILSKKDLCEFHFIGIDEIYDYFEPNIKAVQSDASFGLYKAMQSALSKCCAVASDNTLETRIIKVVATIGIINDSSTLVANKETILSVIDESNEMLSNTLESLCEKKILKYSGAYDRYDFFEASIFDIDEMIAAENQSVSEEAIVNVLNDEFVSFVMYPYSYNRAYKISRVFLPVFTTYSELQKRSFINKFGKFYDGLLVMLLSEHDINLDELKVMSMNLQRAIIFANSDVGEVKEAVRSYIAVKYLESQKSKYVEKDPAFEKELMYYHTELHTQITNFIQKWRNDFKDYTFVIVNGSVYENVHSYAMISAIASDIMSETFSETLIVNNELINKNIVSGSISTAKKNVIGNIINGAKASDYYDAQYLSPDYLAIRSVLVKNGFVKPAEAIVQNSTPSGHMPQIEVARLFDSVMCRAKTEYVSFDEIVTTLKMPPYGLRSGYLSLLIAHEILSYRKSLIITTHGIEQEITVDLFEEIVRRPVDYSFTIANWSAEQDDYLAMLESMFAEYINETSLKRNRLKAICDAMMSHYKNVSKFARTTLVYISEEAKKYRTMIEKTSTNYSSFLFDTLKSIGGDFDSTVETIQKIKAELDGAVNLLTQNLSKSICCVFDVPPRTPLALLFSRGYELEWRKKRIKSFDYYTNSFLDFAGKVIPTEDDYSVIIKLCKSLTGLELIYWNDSHETEFINELQEVRNKLASYQEKAGLNENETQLILKTASGIEKSIVFGRDELSDMSKFVKNKIASTFGNYGLSITCDDKVQILLSLLEELTEGN